MGPYWFAFIQLLEAPFRRADLVLGIAPLYFALVLSEATSTRANFRTAVQTGFSFIWSGVLWLYPYFRAQGPAGAELDLHTMLPVKMFVTFLVLALGVVALVSGLRRRFPKYGRFLGYTRFANYLIITIFPLQVGALRWAWVYVGAIAIFALPCWMVLHFGLMPLRKRASRSNH